MTDLVAGKSAGVLYFTTENSVIEEAEWASAHFLFGDEVMICPVKP
jgi:hypothetical protein